MLSPPVPCNCLKLLIFLSKICDNPNMQKYAKRNHMISVVNCRHFYDIRSRRLLKSFFGHDIHGFDFRRTIIIWAITINAFAMAWLQKKKNECHLTFFMWRQNCLIVHLPIFRYWNSWYFHSVYQQNSAHLQEYRNSRENTFYHFVKFYVDDYHRLKHCM